jgi:hypothetical protein
MQSNNPHVRRLEQPVSAFRVQPDWYEEYWLKPKKALSGVAGWRGQSLFLRITLYSAVGSMLVSAVMN